MFEIGGIVDEENVIQCVFPYFEENVKFLEDAKKNSELALNSLSKDSPIYNKV